MKGLKDCTLNCQLSRRTFLQFCSVIAATLTIPSGSVSKIAEAIVNKQKPYVVWLEFSDCAADTEALLRATNPAVENVLLDIISLEYHETIMAPSGANAEKSLSDVVNQRRGEYLAIIEGAIPTANAGVYCCVSGQTALERARYVCGNARAVIAAGSCASFGGLAAAAPNPTGAVGVKAAVPRANVINLPGCPVNPINLTALLVHYLTFGSFPALDNLSRPLFAYGKRIHDNCERRPHFDAGQFVKHWGDEGHRLGWCLYEMGCKGPQSYMNCPTVRFNQGISWPVMSGHPCFACAVPDSWDVLGPIYSRLPNVKGAGVEAAADTIGLALVAGAAAGAATHAAIRVLKKKREKPRHGEPTVETDYYKTSGTSVEKKVHKKIHKKREINP